MLTEREIEVLKLRKKGLKQTEIAKRLKISQPAVSAFENSISRKINSSIEILDLLKEMDVDLMKIREFNDIKNLRFLHASKFKKRGISWRISNQK